MNSKILNRGVKILQLKSLSKSPGVKFSDSKNIERVMETQ